MRLTRRNPLLSFIITAGALYVLQYVVYHYVLKVYTPIDSRFISYIISSAETLISWFGYRHFNFHETGEEQVIGIDGSTGIWVGPGCNAITLFALYGVFILCYPGRQKHKIWFIPAGIVAIHLLNVLRVALLSVIAFRAPQYLEFNHTYTFNFVIYAFIFLLWMIWVNRFAGPVPKKDEE